MFNAVRMTACFVGKSDAFWVMLDKKIYNDVFVQGKYFYHEKSSANLGISTAWKANHSCTSEVGSSQIIKVVWVRRTVYTWTCWITSYCMVLF